MKTSSLKVRKYLSAGSGCQVRTAYHDVSNKGTGHPGCLGCLGRLAAARLQGAVRLAANKESHLGPYWEYISGTSRSMSTGVPQLHHQTVAASLTCNQQQSELSFSRVLKSELAFYLTKQQQRSAGHYDRHFVLVSKTGCNRRTSLPALRYLYHTTLKHLLYASSGQRLLLHPWNFPLPLIGL